MVEVEPRFSLRRSLIYRGWGRTLRLALRAVVFHLRHGRHATRPQAFDWEYGVETAPDATLVGSRKADEGGVYGPVDTATFTDLMRRGGIRAALARERYDFFDFGCGRGRALLLASEYPFQRIRGVDYDRALLESARHNVALWRSHRPVGKPGKTPRRAGRILCHDIALEWENAAVWEIPRPLRPAVFFFNEPVGGVVLSEIAQRIRRSLAEAPRRAFVVYLGGRYCPVWESGGDFALTYARGDDRVYQYVKGIESRRLGNTEDKAGVSRRKAKHGSERPVLPWSPARLRAGASAGATQQ